MVKKVDKSNHSLTIAPASGGSTKEVQVAAGATITRDGTTASLDQLKEGDDLRASFDPNSNQAKSSRRK